MVHLRSCGSVMQAFPLFFLYRGLFAAPQHQSLQWPKRADRDWRLSGWGSTDAPDHLGPGVRFNAISTAGGD